VAAGGDEAPFGGAVGATSARARPAPRIRERQKVRIVIVNRKVRLK
jgi:hypothetical protein